MKKFVFVCMALLLMVSARAFGQDVRYNFDKDTDFSKFKTYKWVELKDASKPDDLTDKQIKSAVDAQLAQKGLTKTDEDNADLYVVNRDDNSIVQFVIGTDGKLYPQNTVNTPGVFPLAVTTAGNFLVVADTFQPLPTCSPAAPCSGSVAVFPIGAANVLGAPAENSSISAAYWPLRTKLPSPVPLSTLTVPLKSAETRSGL